MLDHVELQIRGTSQILLELKLLRFRLHDHHAVLPEEHVHRNGMSTGRTMVHVDARSGRAEHHPSGFPRIDLAQILRGLGVGRMNRCPMGNCPLVHDLELNDITLLHDESRRRHLSVGEEPVIHDTVSDVGHAFVEVD
ncbi:MAG: hypothetical protein BWY82_01258 [Verrucomicrobia bacterium ADurb.Bin474]|nr:MAG: hypothetical protein BWY82_01258 [Verrucomicrobia bacterium ADurb.Bin474]